ncbi:MAG: M23 family metallopeptidase [Anaerolineales bacterium]|nr:M23 family metallopeptidase [Anaerolineales bacterium]
MQSKDNLKPKFSIFILFLAAVIWLAGCNMPTGGLPAFVAPSSVDRTPTPNWSATLEAAVPPTQQPDSGEVSLPLIEPGLEVPPPPSPTPITTGPILYYTQAGDTLNALAVRFDVSVDEITSPEPIPVMGFINPNLLLIIPNRLSNSTVATHVLPDSELVYSLAAVNFDIQSYVRAAGGYLSGYHEYLGTNGETYGADVIRIIAGDNSINPRLLLALLEYQSGWVTSYPENLAVRDYPLGYIDLQKKGLLQQLKWTVNQLSIGYYGWREGRLSEIRFKDGVTARLAPGLNAGTVALQYYFAQLYDSQGWLEAMDPNLGFPALYERMFGNSWGRALQVEPLFPPDAVQPDLELPFLFGQVWAYTGGPHGAWERDGSWAAIDFAPASTVSGCVDSDAWVTASAAGKVVRSERGIVALDLDGDGFEQTGWVIVYLHIPTEGRVPLGAVVDTGDFLGHPSCEGGYATGTHVHMARKYNGEWIAADGPIPFVLTGWQVHEGSAAYKGTLTRDGETVTASQYGSAVSKIVRDRVLPEQ